MGGRLRVACRRRAISVLAPKDGRRTTVCNRLTYVLQGVDNTAGWCLVVAADFGEKYDETFGAASLPAWGTS